MALIVETGSGAADAESYVSVSDANAYHTARGNAAWTGSESVKEAALRRATDYMLQSYAQRWQGDRVSETQALDWPRSGVYAHGYLIASDTVPAAVANACAELALRALSESLLPDAGRVTASEKVGPIAVAYLPHGRSTKAWSAVDAMLEPYLGGLSGVNRRVVRA